MFSHGINLRELLQVLLQRAIPNNAKGYTHYCNGLHPLQMYFATSWLGVGWWPSALKGRNIIPEWCSPRP